MVDDKANLLALLTRVLAKSVWVVTARGVPTALELRFASSREEIVERTERSSATNSASPVGPTSVARGAWPPPQQADLAR